MGIVIQVKSNRLPAISRAARPAVGDAIHALGFTTEGKQKQRARVDTGNMRNQTHNDPTGPLSTTLHADAPYSGFLDMGTSRIPADHWFSGPVHEAGQQMPSVITAAIKGVTG